MIHIENLYKSYRISSYQRPAETLVGDLARMLKGGNRSKQTLEVLKDINLNIQPGEVMGIVGSNGAGKSTLLRIIAGISLPDKGRVRYQGRIASLLEVGTGFHMDMNGYENIFVNGAMLGMTRREIRSKLDEIIDFSGIEQFLSTPIKHYSTGMKMRLAFAVAAHLPAEILLIDEILAVGDAQFQTKSLDKMKEVTQSGRTILFVSHQVSAIKQLCHRVALIRGGIVAALGQPNEVISEYLQTDQSHRYQYNRAELERIAEVEGVKPVFTSLTLVSIIATSNGVPLPNIITVQQPVEIELQIEVHHAVAPIFANLHVYNDGGAPLFYVESNSLEQANEALSSSKTGLCTLKCVLPAQLFTNGTFTLSLQLWHGRHQKLWFKNLLKWELTRGENNFTNDAPLHLSLPWIINWQSGQNTHSVLA